MSHAKRLGAVLASHDDTTADQVAASVAHGIGFAEFPTTLAAGRRADLVRVASMGETPVVRGVWSKGHQVG